MTSFANFDTEVTCNTKTVTSKSRGWLITLNNPDDIDKKNIDDLYSLHGAEYLIYSLEKGKEGTYHYQGFVYFKNARAFTTIKKLLPGAHIEAAKSNNRCIAYCQKQDTHVEGPWEFGEKPQQGKRSDISDAIDVLKNHGMDAVISLMPEIYVKYGKGLRELEYQLIPERDKDNPGKRFWIYGKGGVGKSSIVKMYDPKAYIKGGTKWWDKYHGQKTILVDDFNGVWEFRDFLRFLDRWEFDCEIKASYTRVPSADIFITCEHPPWHFWEGNELYQVTRRFHMIFELKEEDELDDWLDKIWNCPDELPEDKARRERREARKKQLDPLPLSSQPR